MSSLTDFEKEKFNELISNFHTIKKRVLQKRPISNNQEKIGEYINLLIETYNNILLYTKPYDENLSVNVKAKIHSKILHSRELLLRCFCRLNSKIKVPFGEDLFELVDTKVMTDSDSETDVGDSEDDKKTLEDSADRKEDNIAITENITESTGMASIEEKTKFISMCSNIIRDNYDGNPLNLNSFIDKINLIEELAAPNLTICFISFIKSKLDGKAREVLPDNITSVDQIKNSLKSRIKPDNSKVVAGRIAALHVKGNNYTDFAKHVEDLADALQRSLVIEGITKEKAQEMAIEQTVTICRNNAKSDMVKAILASTNFTEPKDVVAKLIVEESTIEKGPQVLAMRSSRNRSNYEYGNRNEMRPQRGNHNNSYRSHSYGNYRGHNNNFRGRNYNNRGRHNNNANYNQGSRDNFRSRGAFVRTLNEEVPQQEMLREDETQI